MPNQHSGMTTAELMGRDDFRALLAERVDGKLRSYGSIARALRAAGVDVCDATVQRAGARLRSGEEAPAVDAAGEAVRWTETQEGATVESAKLSGIRTLEDLIAAASIDLDVWEVAHWQANKWETATKGRDGSVRTTPLFQVKAWLRRIPGVGVLREIHAELLADIAAHAPAYPMRVPAPRGESGYLLEVSAFDLHVGKLAWAEETGDENYDSKIAAAMLDDALTDALAKAAPFRPERILFPVGNDLLHTDGPMQTTTGGTPQDADTRHARMFTRACQLMVRAIDRLELVAPVDVVVVPGNHDRDAAFKLGEVLAAWYRNCDRVTVDNAPTLRKYVRWGTSLIGFTHGSEERHADLPLIMANERPGDWAETAHHEWHIGHLHTRRQTRYTAGDTHGGVVVRILPSLSGTDAWHARRGFVKGPRAMEAYLYHRDTGYAAHFSSNHIAARTRQREAA